MHMTAEEVQRRSAATIQARQQDAARNGIYYRVWIHLRRKQLVALSGDRTALADELLQITAEGGGISRELTNTDPKIAVFAKEDI
jgi:hypothetical protein